MPLHPSAYNAAELPTPAGLLRRAVLEALQEELAKFAANPVASNWSALTKAMSRHQRVWHIPDADLMRLTVDLGLHGASGNGSLPPMEVPA